MTPDMAQMVEVLTTLPDLADADAAERDTMLASINLAIGVSADRFGVDLSDPAMVEALLVGTMLGPSLAVAHGLPFHMGTAFVQHAIARRLR